LKSYFVKTKHHLLALYLASQHRQTPLAAKTIIGLVVAYAASPIDLVPDFIPIIGQLDDLLIVSMGQWVVARMIPKSVWQESLVRAETTPVKLVVNKKIVCGIVVITLAGISGLIAYWNRC